MKLITFIKNHFDIIIPLLFLIITWLFFFPYSILLIFIYPISILIYRNRIIKVKNYHKYNTKTKINFYLSFFIILFFSLIPLSGKDYLYNSYQKNVIFSCYNLNRYNENELIQKTYTWYKTEDSLLLLLSKVKECHITKATPLLSYLTVKAPRPSNPFDNFHALGSRNYNCEPENVFLNFYPNIKDNISSNLKPSDLGIFMLDYYKKIHPDFNSDIAYNLIFTYMGYTIIYDK
jgi:hypothetical protein